MVLKNKLHIMVGFGIFIFVVAVISHRVIVATPTRNSDPSWEVHYRQGAKFYQNKDMEKAIISFKQSLILVFPDVSLNQSDNNEKTLRSQFNDEKMAAQARYQLGLIYESQAKPEMAAVLLRDSLAVVATRGARYLGYKDGCKSCHFKEWKSWKKTKMAQAFEILKPGVRTEEKIKLEFDPLKDYTQDPECLTCHTTGYALPGGYQIPTNAGFKIRKAAEQTEGGTCEACHGPGSKYGPVHKDVDDKARPYHQDEFYAVGEYKVDERVCGRCHNRRNPTADDDYHFDFKEHKDKGTHENYPLLYRIKKNIH